MREYSLKFHCPANNFNEALPIGNGCLGAMVYGQYPIEKLTVNQDTLWTGKPHRFKREGAYQAYCDAVSYMDSDRYSEAEKSIEERFTVPFTDSYLPLGTITYELQTESVHRYSRTLKMKEGVAQTKCSEFCFEHLASESFHCITSNLIFEKPSSLTIRFSSELACDFFPYGDAIVAEGKCPTRIEKGVPIYSDFEDGIRFSAVLMVKTDGQRYVSDNAFSIRNAKQIEVFFTTETSFFDHNNISKNNYLIIAYERAMLAQNAGYSKILKSQKQYYHKYFNRVRVSFFDGTFGRKATDERLASEQKDLGLIELLFNFGRYLTIASSTKGSQATTLQGIWNENIDPIWKSNYTVNINTEMNYWHTLPCGLKDFHFPIIDLVEKIADTGADTAQHYYHAEGFVCHHNIDLWGNTAAVGGAGDEFIPGNSNFSYWCGASGWLCRNVFEYYEYTLDENYLRETAYPLMKSAADFYKSILRFIDGKMVVSPATSPENQYLVDEKIHSFGKWTTVMQSIIEDLFRNCIRACEILHCDQEWKNELERIIPYLKPFEIGKDGLLLEWDRSVNERDPQHRHVSHLYGLYPAELITTEKTPELAKACQKVLERRGDEGTGWSIAWKACLWAKLKDGNHALKLIKRQLQIVDSEHTSCELWGGGTYPNLFCAHPPFQIDGNFGVTAAIALLLLQCEDNQIKILPALPDELSSHGFVKGLMAKGNVCVDIEWNNKIAEYVSLISPTEQSVLLSINGKKLHINLIANRKYYYHEIKA